MIERSYKGKIPTTKKGATKTDADTIADCDNPDLRVLVEYKKLEKAKSTYILKLFNGFDFPIHANFNVLVASGRTSCSGPNLQNQPRLVGVRECFIPRPKKVFVACDYDSQELRTLAQACLDLLGKSRLAERYQANPSFDPHLNFAASLLGISEEAAAALKSAGDRTVKDARQRAKVANFGFAGGLGAEKFVSFAKGYGVEFTIDEATEIKKRWLMQWPEMPLYFNYISSIVGDVFGSITQLRSGRRRGAVGYCDAANTYFQGLAADASKAALFATSCRCYSDKNSALYGARIVNFVHDEIILEADEATAASAAAELESVMVTEMSNFTPDVPVKATAALLRYWSKEAEPVYSDEGSLEVWG